MTPALATPRRTECYNVNPSEWVRSDKIMVIRCTHGPDEGGRFAQTEQPKWFPRNWNAATPVLSPLDQIIQASRAILQLEVDEDEGQVPYAQETWTRAVEFLRRNAKWVSDTLGLVVDLPVVLPGPDGSIDLHWDYPGYEILINIPADPNANAGFYGDDRGQMCIKTKFDLSTFNHGLLLWLAGTK